MANKNKARKPASITGNNESNIVMCKITKRNRIKQYILARKWQHPHDVLTSENAVS